MNNSSKDKIFDVNGEIRHESAGGFVFYDDPIQGLMVPLVKKIDGTYWMPKGHVTEDETPEEAASRELMEELSLEDKPKLIAKVGIESYSFSLSNDSRKHYKDVHVFVFGTDKKLKLSNTKMQLIDGEKGRFDNPEWVTVSEAGKKLDYDAEVLNKSKKTYLMKTRTSSTISKLNS